VATVPSSTSTAPKENTRPKTTLNLQNILKPQAKVEEKVAEIVAQTVVNKSINQAELKKVWDEFAELKKTQAGEYSLLTRGFDLNENKITISLANPVEEPLLQSIRTQLTAYLRDKLNNSNINVFGVMQAIETKRMAYTNKEKFDYLAEKNPILLELKERLGLDTDY
jgi:DNA polymerase-3 subunit gamma/tau